MYSEPSLQAVSHKQPTALHPECVLLFLIPACIFDPQTTTPHIVHQTVRVAVTNEGVIPTRFTITATSASTSSTPPESSHAYNEDRVDTNPAGGSGHHPDGPEGYTRKEICTRPDRSSAEAELLDKASAVGDAGRKYSKGKRAIEVMDGGGELAGYGSAEIVVVFAPLTVGEFRTVKVGLRRGQSSPTSFSAGGAACPSLLKLAHLSQKL